MGLGPGIYIGAMGWIPSNPGLGHRVVQVGPLSHDMGVALEFILLKPSLDVGSNQLPGFRSALIFNNWSERVGNAVAQEVVRGSVGRGGRGRRVVRGGGEPRLKVFVLGEWLGDQPGADNCAVRTFYQTPI